MAGVGELRDLGDEELLERLDSSKEELFNLRFQLATGQLDNPMRIKQLRRGVAQILTILRERDIERELVEHRSEESVSSDEGSSSEAVAPRRRFARRSAAGQKTEES